MSQWILIFEDLRIENSAQILNQQGKKILKLYQDSDWRQQIEYSPSLVALDPQNDKLLELYEKDPLWASNGVIFIYPDQLSESDILQDLQRNITLYSQTQHLYKVRFYDPRVLIKLIPTLNAEQKSQLLGAAEKVVFSQTVQNYLGVISFVNPEPKLKQAPVILPEKAVKILMSS